jgi:hypothetical protein
MARFRTSVATYGNCRLLQRRHYSKSAASTALSEKPVARMIAERLGAPVITLQRLDAAMPRHVHDFEKLSAVLCFATKAELNRNWKML